MTDETALRELEDIAWPVLMHELGAALRDDEPLPLETRDLLAYFERRGVVQVVNVDCEGKETWARVPVGDAGLAGALLVRTYLEEEAE